MCKKTLNWKIYTFILGKRCRSLNSVSRILLELPSRYNNNFATRTGSGLSDFNFGRREPFSDILIKIYRYI